MTCPHDDLIATDQIVTCRLCPLSVEVVYPDERQPDTLTEAEQRFRDATTPEGKGPHAQYPRRYRVWAEQQRVAWAWTREDLRGPKKTP